MTTWLGNRTALIHFRELTTIKLKELIFLSLKGSIPKNLEFYPKNKCFIERKTL